MTQVTAFSILALTVSLALRRPRIFSLQIGHAPAAVLGAALCLVTGIVPPHLAWRTVEFLAVPLATIVSLMVITLVAERAGVFQYMAHRIARAAAGSAPRLFTLIFCAGAATGSVFTNDAAVLIFTPVVFGLIEQTKERDWTLSNKLPFYFAVLYVSNVVGLFVISNPINIIVSRYFHVSFLEYARWMVLPALVSIVTSYVGLRLAFRRDLPRTYKQPEPLVVGSRQRRNMLLCAAVLVPTLVAFFSEEWTDVPTWIVAAVAAGVLLALHATVFRGRTGDVVAGVGWDVLIFVVGIFIVAEGIRHVGLTVYLADLLEAISGDSVLGLTTATGLTAGAVSAVMNNHPTAGAMALTIADMPLEGLTERAVVLSALIGGDLGPKMLPTGSLAALMWFRILRDKGVHVSYWRYVRIGVPVTLAAIVLSVLTLNAELWLYGWLFP
ncbi:MAG TPA: ArsB/NhaD family transporter [Planctomycetaceae bacterium]|nr:ArsB/NhaD family transporter [Planctomycetaceae bacterium]